MNLKQACLLKYGFFFYGWVTFLSLSSCINSWTSLSPKNIATWKKKYLTGLLLLRLRAAAANFFLLQKKKTTRLKVTFKKILLSENGNWIHFLNPKDSGSNLIADAMNRVDPHLKKYEYEFTKVEPSGFEFEWIRSQRIASVMNGSNEDPACLEGISCEKNYKEVFDVSILNRDSLSMQSKRQFDFQYLQKRNREIDLALCRSKNLRI